MQFTITTPEWLNETLAKQPTHTTDIEAQMRLVIECAKRNIEHQTGGPFAAAVFNEKTGELVSVGVNRVMKQNCSSAHAEVVALSLAQQKLQNWDLSAEQEYRLVVNWRPCIMCYGATIWAGIKHLVIAGDTQELERITGFDEGPFPNTWRKELATRNISVTANILKSDAIKIFEQFRDSGQTVYNANNNTLHHKN